MSHAHSLVVRSSVYAGTLAWPLVISLSLAKKRSLAHRGFSLLVNARESSRKPSVARLDMEKVI